MLVLQKRYKTLKTILLSYRDATGKFPDFPADDEGGSAAIFKERTADDVEAELKGKVN